MKKITTLATVAIIMFITSFSASAQHGYRGFADAVLGGEIGDGESGFIGGISTVHGYQTGHLFFGAGASLLASSLYYADDDNPSLPIFAQIRYDYSLTSAKSFFALIKGGYDPLAQGGYAGLGGGIRFAINKGITAINVGLNLQIRDVPESYYLFPDEKITCYSPVLTVGIEF